MNDQNLSYSSYLQLNKLLALQKTLAPCEVHDELLFIIIHQIYELWFKQMIHELLKFKEYLSSAKHHKMVSCLKRIRHILKVIVLQVDILETMGPLSFLSFRDYLGKASGFQSLQFREFEFLLGLKNPKYLSSEYFNEDQRKQLYVRYHDTSIWEDFLTFLRNIIQNNESDAINAESIEDQLTENQKLLIYIYKNPSIYTQMAESLLDIDEGLQEWRYRHLKIVERTIGNAKTGTGGSSGVDYLKTISHTSFCPELWQIRNYF